MSIVKSLDEVNLVAAQIDDVQRWHHDVYQLSESIKDKKKVLSRFASEGIGFLTKTMPKLGKSLDKALAEVEPLNCSKLRFTALPETQLPRFLGELFKRVLQPSGWPLPDPDANSVRALRQILYSFYKYEIPYTDEQERQVIAKFERTEQELSTVTDVLNTESISDNDTSTDRRECQDGESHRSTPKTKEEITHEAKRLLQVVFGWFDPTNIYPRHGPGAVATKQQLWEKYLWSNISDRIAAKYPVPMYFYMGPGHCCDHYEEFSTLGSTSHSARVVLVPKDSRGPRLISCEPVDYQWIQQGLAKAIVEWVEAHDVTRHHVHFTIQRYNQIGALHGSKSGRYATLDLNEASDRVSVELVRLLFPSELYSYLEACRSLSTELPDGRKIQLNKFAPMGSALCFPILALVIWSLLTAGAPDEYTRERILVYGDDVIVTQAYARDAMNILESFGLKINRDKSCTQGFFRESCGMDAFKGVDVTPVRFRTVWESSPHPDAYTSWIAYANSFYDRQYYSTYYCIVEALYRVYGPMPDASIPVTGCPSLRVLPRSMRTCQSRTNHKLQKREWKVRTVRSESVTKELSGWSMLLRYFAERARRPHHLDGDSFHDQPHDNPLEDIVKFSVSSYTPRKRSMLRFQWR